MKCIALATRFGIEKITWYVPQGNYPLSAFFARQSLRALEDDLKEEITELCDRLQSGDSIKFTVRNNYIHIQEQDDNCCAVICDVELTKEQMKYLSLYLLSNQIPLSDIANDLEKYTQDFKIQAIKADVADVLKVMKQNWEKALERDSKIETLVDKASELEKSSIRFQRTVHEKTSSCWPSSCTIL